MLLVMPKKAVYAGCLKIIMKSFRTSILKFCWQIARFFPRVCWAITLKTIWYLKYRKSCYIHCEFFPSLSDSKIESCCPNFDPYTSSRFDSILEKMSQFDPEKLSQIESNSTMTQLLSQVDSKKLPLLLATQFPNQLTQKLSHGRIWVNLTQFCVTDW